MGQLSLRAPTGPRPPSVPVPQGRVQPPRDEGHVSSQTPVVRVSFGALLNSFPTPSVGVLLVPHCPYLSQGSGTAPPRATGTLDSFAQTLPLPRGPRRPLPPPHPSRSTSLPVAHVLTPAGEEKGLSVSVYRPTPATPTSPSGRSGPRLPTDTGEGVSTPPVLEEFKGRGIGDGRRTSTPVRASFGLWYPPTWGPGRRRSSPDKHSTTLRVGSPTSGHDVLHCSHRGFGPTVVGSFPTSHDASTSRDEPPGGSRGTLVSSGSARGSTCVGGPSCPRTSTSPAPVQSHTPWVPSPPSSFFDESEVRTRSQRSVPGTGGRFPTLEWRIDRLEGFEERVHARSSSGNHPVPSRVGLQGTSRTETGVGMGPRDVREFIWDEKSVPLTPGRVSTGQSRGTKDGSRASPPTHPSPTVYRH